MVHRFSSASIAVMAAATACSLFAPSDSEFFNPEGASGTGAAGDDAATMGGTAGNAGRMASSGGSSASGADGRGGATSGAAGALGTGATEGRGGTAVDAAASDAGASADVSGCVPRLVYDFDSGSLAGVSSDFPLEVRTFDGSPALAMNIGQLNAVSYVAFTLSICAGGSVDLRAKTLSFRTYFQGIPASTGELVLQVWLPTRSANGGALGAAAPSTGVWTSVSVPLSKSVFSSTATTIMVEVASTGVQFSGTIWFDDFRIQ